MKKCKKCGDEFDEVLVQKDLEEEFDSVYEMVSEIKGMCECCAMGYLDNLARIGRDYMNGN